MAGSLIYLVCLSISILIKREENKLKKKNLLKLQITY